MAQPQLLEGQSGLPVDNPTKSYWHKEPSEKLLGHRTTRELPRSADVVIVGSGLTGSFAAHFLKEKQPDLNIVILEAREACWGATGRNGGHCQPAIYGAATPQIASFELRNFSYLKNLVEEFSIPCDWRSTSGVHAFYSAELFARARERVASLADEYPDLAANVAVVTHGEGSLGGSPAYLLEGERRELTLAGLRVPDAAGAIVQWNAASLWPYKLVAFVLERLLATYSDAGKPGSGSFNLQTNTPATGLTQAETTIHLHSPSTTSKPTSTSTSTTSTSTSTTWTVHTPRGTITAPKVLLATNAYTSHLLPQFSTFLVPTRGQVSALKPPQPPTVPPLDIAHTYYIEGEPDSPYERDDYLVQRPPAAAELVYGGGRRHARRRGVGVWDDGAVDQAVAWYLRGELTAVLDLSARPGSGSGSGSGEGGGDGEGERESQSQSQSQSKKQDLEPTHEWTGIMGYTRDGFPFVGAVPPSLGGGDSNSSTGAGAGGGGEGGLYLCAGYNGHGMPNAVLSAKATIDMMYGGEEAEIDLPPEYELTEQRVARALLQDEVAVVDARGCLWRDFCG